MNAEIESIFKDFIVDNKQIPVAFLRYNGNKNTYVTYQESDKDGSYSGDDELLGYIDYYDFDVYSKGNYLAIIKEIKRLMKQNNWTYQPSRESEDMYEDDTGFYHKTICFAKEIQDEMEE
jgi:hypothetical protein